MLLLTIHLASTNYVPRLMVHKKTLRAGERFRETRTGRNRIAAERQIERKYDPRKPLMHPRSHCKRPRVLASLGRIPNNVL